MFGDDEAVLRLVNERNCKIPESELLPNELSLFLRVSKEAIFYVQDEVPHFDLVMVCLQSSTMALQVVNALSVILEDDEAGDAWNGAKEFLAMAQFEGVPVLADTSEVEPRLLELVDDLVKNGFRTRFDGKVMRITTKRHFSPLEQGCLTLTEHWLAGEHELARRQLAGEVERMRLSVSALSMLDEAIAQLEEVLSTDHQEADLQRCATKWPILFGWEYLRLIPQHRLGDDYIMDYALERYSHVVDLVEIEGSSHKLYTSKGDPSNALVHAEQQVYDWLDWLERHNTYAREKLPGLLRPQGFVVIGRRASLSERDQRMLRQRNQVHRGAFEVLTWDDLVDRANALRLALQQSR